MCGDDVGNGDGSGVVEFREAETKKKRSRNKGYELDKSSDGAENQECC